MKNAHRLLLGRTILLIDANPSSRQMITAMLRDHGCRNLHLARNARESLDLFDVTAGRLDLVVCAFELPRVNGLAVAKAVRMGRTPALPWTPIVMYDPKSDAALSDRAAALDIGHVFGLPVAAQRLCQTLDELISGPILTTRPVETYAEVSVEWAPTAPVVSEQRGLTAREAASMEARRLAEEEARGQETAGAAPALDAAS
jgi:CheY-like chemotaxis protein